MILCGRREFRIASYTRQFVLFDQFVTVSRTKSFNRIKVLSQSISIDFKSISKMEPSTSSGKTDKKRKREVMTIEKKIEIIGEIKKNLSISVLAKRYDVPRSTIYDLKNNADKIIEWSTKMESWDAQPKKTKNNENGEALGC